MPSPFRSLALKSLGETADVPPRYGREPLLNDEEIISGRQRTMKLPLRGSSSCSAQSEWWNFTILLCLFHAKNSELPMVSE